MRLSTSRQDGIYGLNAWKVYDTAFEMIPRAAVGDLDSVRWKPTKLFQEVKFIAAYCGIECSAHHCLIGNLGPYACPSETRRSTLELYIGIDSFKNLYELGRLIYS